MRNHRRSSSSIRSSPTHGMDLKTNAGGGGEGNKGSQNNDHHRFSPGPDLSMLQKSYVHRDNGSVPEEMMGFNQGYEMPPNNSLEQSCNNETSATTNRLHPFGPFAPTPSGANNNGGGGGGSPFCTQGGSAVAAAAAAAAVGLSQQSQLNNGQGSGGAPPSFMDTPPPSSFCGAPYNYSLYSMHSQDSRVKMEKEKEVLAAAAAYNNKHSVEDKELAAAKWITS